MTQEDEVAEAKLSTDLSFWRMQPGKTLFAVSFRMRSRGCEVKPADEQF